MTRRITSQEIDSISFQPQMMGDRNLFQPSTPHKHFAEQASRGMFAFGMDGTMDTLSLVIQIIGFAMVILLYFMGIGNKEFPNMSESCITLLLFFVGGISGQFAVSFVERREIRILNKWNVNTPVQAIITAALCLVAQVVVQILFGLKLFQVTVWMVYAFYVSAAVAEESLFRGVLCKVIFEVGEKISTHKLILGIIAALGTGAVFGIAHQRYWSLPAVFWGTIICGIVLSFGYLTSDNLTVPIFAHAVINFMASANIVQTLQK